MTKTFNLKHLIGCILLPLFVGGISSLLSVGTKEVYKSLIKPPLSPPSWVFPIVWTVLYIFMGIAACLIKDSKKGNKDDALRVYYIQLIVNALWSPVFFSLHLYWAALIVLVALWVLAVITAVRFRNIDTSAGNLILIYVIWLTYAAYLNMAFACINK